MASIILQRRDRQAGFTLLEMIVVVAILGLALILIVGYRPPWSGGLGVRGAASKLASTLRLARSEAIARDTPVSVAIDVASRRYRVGEGPVQALPPSLKVEFLTLASNRNATNSGVLRFYPDGSSTGGRVTVGDGAHTLVVGVDWLNGRVSIGDER
ncbi:MAG TPA: GspH/FimT family pseudopilin [Stellaceae bacterium]|nr:GspH/FimT family pseudopilin [Stellaceae bacterium]